MEKAACSSSNSEYGAGLGAVLWKTGFQNVDSLVSALFTGWYRKSYKTCVEPLVGSLVELPDPTLPAQRQSS